MQHSSPLHGASTPYHGVTRWRETECGGRGGYFHNLDCEIGAAIHHGLLLFVFKIRTFHALEKTEQKFLAPIRLRGYWEVSASYARASSLTSVQVFCCHIREGLE